MSQRVTSQSQKMNDAIRNIVRGYLGSKLGDVLTSELSDMLALHIAESIEQYMENISHE